MKGEKSEKKKAKKKNKKKNGSAVPQELSAVESVIQEEAPKESPMETEQDMEREPKQTPQKEPRKTTEQQLPNLEKALSLVGGKWKMPLLWALRDGQEMRYSEIKRQIAGITDVMLSQSLKELTVVNLVARRQYGELPPRVSYQITETGSRILPALEQLAAWGETMEIPEKRVTKL